MKNTKETQRRAHNEKEKWSRVLPVLLVMVTVISLLPGCGRKRAEKEDAETITVYLWSTNLYEKYAPYIQKQPGYPG